MDKCSYIKDPIQSTGSLARDLSIPVQELQRVKSLPDSEKYKKPKTIAYKSDGTERKIMSPVKCLRRIQHRINKNILKTNIHWPSYLYGSIPNNNKNSIPQDYISAASQHCGSKSICKLDISNFFDNIHKIHVSNIFERLFKFDQSVSEILTDLVTFENHLVQGALTSSYLALLILFDSEPIVVERLKRKGIKYTRLVDDITLSIDIHNYDFSLCIKIVENMLNDKDLILNRDKILTTSISTDVLTVHGLNVSFNKPCLPKKEAKRIRAAVRFIEHLSQKENAKTEMWFRDEYYKCLGRVYKLDRFGKKKAFNSLLSRLEKVSPLPSIKDVKYTKSRVTRLENDFKNPSKSASYNYMKRYSIASNKVIFLKKKFEKESISLRNRLRAIPPSYKL